MTGIEAFLEVLASFGVRHIFGNPGTTELPLNDRLAVDRRFQYVLGLQEVAVMGMADGYAMASGQPAVVNVHICCGLGHAMGGLYNAWREGTPLIVTAGQQDRRLQLEEPILGGDMVSVARPWTKWAYEVTRVEDVPVALRRALQTALTPPTGPVFLSLPIDVQMESSSHFDLTPLRLPDPHVRPPTAAIAEAAATLRSARQPAILAGSRIVERQAMNALIGVAELLGAPVFSEPGHTHGRLCFPSDHPLNRQGLPLWSPEIRQQLEGFDVLLVVGMDLLRQYVYHEPARAIPESIKIVQIDEEAWQLNKNYVCTVPVLGHTRVALEELGERLRREMQPDDVQRAHERAERWAGEHAAARARLRERIESERDMRPLTPRCFMQAVADVLPDEVTVVEEAVTTTNTLLERLGALKKNACYFGHRGWALGWGLNVAIGARLARPDVPAVAILGEGAACYGMQGLWSAARYQVPVTFVIANNAQYQILKIGAQGFALPEAQAGRFEGLDLAGPEVDLVAVARGLGVEALRVTEPDALRQTLRDSMTRTTPLLVDVPISREIPRKLNYG